MQTIAMALATLAILAPAEARQEADVISVHEQPRGVICTGICPSFQIEISDGWVTGVHDLSLYERAKPVQYRITHAQYLKSRERLSAFRPAEGQSVERSCDNGEGAGHGAPHELTWYGEGRTVHRSACGGTKEDHAMFCAMIEALYAVDFDLFAGNRLKRHGGLPDMLQYVQCGAAS